MDSEKTEVDASPESNNGATVESPNNDMPPGGQPDQKKFAAPSGAIPETKGGQGERDDGGPSSDSACGSSRIAEKLDRELALSNTNRLQLRGRWRQALRKEKFQELRGDIPRLTQFHDRSVARKREVVDALRKEIASLQDLYRDAMVANANRTEDLIAIHDERVVKLERDFRDGVSSLRSRFRADVERIEARYEREKESTRRRTERRAREDEARIAAMRQGHQHELEDIRNRNLEHVNGLRFVMDSRVEDLEEQFEQARGEFAQNTDGDRAARDQLRSKEERMRREIESKTREANRLQREIQRFQLMARQEEAQIAERHEELLARKTRAIARWNMTQEAMSKFRDAQQKRLTDLIFRANRRKEVLRRQCALAERVRTIATKCRKWESSREEFASLLRESACPELAATAEEPREEGGRAGSPSPSPSPSPSERNFIIDCMGRLGDNTRHFWNKQNSAKLDVLALEKEVRSLRRREADLKDKLKAYRNGIAVNDDVLRDRNPLFVINGRMNAMPHHVDNKHHPGKKRAMRRLTVVDGNHFFATNSIAQVAHW